MTHNAICETCGAPFRANYIGRRTCSMMCRKNRPLEARLWERIDRSGGPDSCWPWQGARTPQGYGSILQAGAGSTRLVASRVAYESAIGLIPAGLHVLHDCDNPPCCNPGHLHVGTRSDNMREAVERGLMRTPAFRGESNARAKLTAADVEVIRRRYAAGGITYRKLATEYGMSENMIGRIIRQESW